MLAKYSSGIHPPYDPNYVRKSAVFNPAECKGEIPMDEVKTPTPTERFVKTMTHKMFSDFYYAMQARLHTDVVLNNYLNPKASLSLDEIQLVRQSRKIDAIKAVRQRVGLGLKEAKDLVDDWCHHNPT